MSTNSPKQNEDKEIDLSAISKGLGDGFQKFNTFLYNCIRFFIKNIIVIVILVVVGVGLGIFMDKDKVYDHQVIVTPNFESTDYFYAKVELLNSKMKERDTTFLKSIGIKDAQKMMQINVRPILDPYKFLNANELNYKIFELISGDSDADKAIAANVTSKNYTYHLISFTTIEKTSNEKTIVPIMAYLNNSAYFSKIQKTFIENAKLKLKENEVIIAQIDNILNQLSVGNPGSNGNLVYNENSQLNDIIDSKDKLIREQGNIRISLLGLDQIVKKNSDVLNVRNKESVTGKMKLILPLLFIGVFILFYHFMRFYKNQSLKQRQDK